MIPGGVRVVGIDGGATRTRYLLAGGSGEILAGLEGGGTLIGAGRDREVADTLARDVSDLVTEAGCDLPLDTLCAGLAGVAGRPEARKGLEDRLREVGVARRVHVVTDAEVAFLDAFGEKGGILLIAGTGSIAFGRVEGGPFSRVGGWGALLGDEGSGYWVGLEGIHVAIRGAEDRGGGTGLTEALFRSLGVESIPEVLAWSQTAEKAGVAGFAPRVVEEADRGDVVAREVVARALDALVAHVKALSRRLDASSPLEVALVGGLIEPGGPLHDRLRARLTTEGFGALTREVAPARGAVGLALRL